MPNHTCESTSGLVQLQSVLCTVPCTKYINICGLLNAHHFQTLCTASCTLVLCLRSLPVSPGFTTQPKCPSAMCAYCNTHGAQLVTFQIQAICTLGTESTMLASATAKASSSLQSSRSTRPSCSRLSKPCQQFLTTSKLAVSRETYTTPFHRSCSIYCTIPERRAGSPVAASNRIHAETGD